MSSEDLNNGDSCSPQLDAQQADASWECSSGPPKWRSTRFCLAYTVSLGMMVMFYQRTSFSMAIVCMVNHTAIRTPQNLGHHTGHVSSQSFLINVTQSELTSPPLTSAYVSIEATKASMTWWATTTTTQTTTAMIEDVDDGECQRNEESDSSDEEDGPLVWDKSVQGLLLGALYWGYMVGQLPGAYIIQRQGERRTVAVAMATMSLMHALCHVGALLSPWAVFSLRVGMGVCTGMAIPGMYGVWGRWAPVGERTRLLSLAFAGQMVANASAFPASAALCRLQGFLGGWPAIYYVFGLTGLLWSILWFVTISDTPESHRRISPAERDYIVTSRSAVGTHKEKVSVPWRSMLTSHCFWAIMVAQFTYNWGFFLMLSNLPIFMYEAMNFDLQSNGAYSMLPYLLLLITLGGSGFLSDLLVARRMLTVIGARRAFTAVGYLTPAVLLVVMSHQGCSQVALVVSLLVLAVGATGLANTAGYYVNPYDIAPRFATDIIAASNTIATAAGIVNPYVVAHVTSDGTREQWRVVFYITAAIFTFGTVFFCVFARGEVQPWAATPAVEIIVECDHISATNEKLTPVDSTHA